MLWSPLGAIPTNETGVLTERREEAEEYEPYEPYEAAMISPRSGRGGEGCNALEPDFLFSLSFSYSSLAEAV